MQEWSWAPVIELVEAVGKVSWHHLGYELLLLVDALDDLLLFLLYLLPFTA